MSRAPRPGSEGPSRGARAATLGPIPSGDMAVVRDEMGHALP